MGRKSLQFPEQETVTLLDTLDLQWLRIVVEVMGSNDPRGQVAKIKRTVSRSPPPRKNQRYFL